MRVRFIVLLIIFIMLSLVTPTSIADELGVRNLKMGMRGNDVQQLQENLKKLGYNLAIDGIFGPETDAVVRQFQRQYQLAVDGIVGPQTLSVLLALVNTQQVYVVKAGDTLSHIAKKYGVTYQQIMDVNNLSSTSIYPGQQLVIPTGSAVNTQEYVVQSGDNLSTIAQRFGLSAADLAEFNALSDPNKIRVGQLLSIPTTTVVTATTRTTKPSFIWPVEGPISSPYGWRIHPITKVRHFHGGIDIAAPQGTIIRAAAPGRVIKAEWMGDFGYGIVIDHGGGYTTWYGHCSQFLVKVGDQVSANQPIARVGSTGLTTGPHLDFRIKLNNETLNPLDLLPRK